jgi:hypothetical protein
MKANAMPKRPTVEIILLQTGFQAPGPDSILLAAWPRPVTRADSEIPDPAENCLEKP